MGDLTKHFAGILSTFQGSLGQRFRLNYARRGDGAVRLDEAPAPGASRRPGFSGASP
jgi:hypothetical protein